MRMGDGWDAGVRRSAVHALGKLRDTAAPHKTKIIGLLRDPDASVRAVASIALGELAGAPAVPPSVVCVPTRATNAAEMASAYTWSPERGDICQHRRQCSQRKRF